jgi:hypothetical protein
MLNSWSISVKGDRPGYLLDGRRWRPILTLNARIHWADRARCMAKDKGVVWASAHAQNAPDRPAKPWSRARVDIGLVVRTAVRRDADNAIAACKGIIDGLVDAGIIADDSLDVVDGPYLSITRGADYGYTVTVTPGWDYGPSI